LASFKCGVTRPARDIALSEVEKKTKQRSRKNVKLHMNEMKGYGHER
jgi:hypothetical protein